MNPFKLLITIVPHGKSEKLTRSAMESGCNGGTVLSGRGLAESNLAAVIGLGESAKDLVMMVVDEKSRKAVMNSIIQAASLEKKNFGVIFSAGVDSFFKPGQSASGEAQVMEKNEEEEKMDSQNEMITVIVNKGYADDVMAAARSAGAGGGTVVNARGTARETDQRFFGMHIVPEKEMLIILVPSDKKDAVMAKIQDLNCLKTPGMGIAWSSAVKDFALLGKSK